MEVESTEMLNVASAQQGRVTGIIIPPPDVRARVDKTANYVAKFGKSFEQRILASEEGKTAKFNFMKPFDPYHAYYEFKIREIEEGDAPAAEAKRSEPHSVLPPPPPQLKSNASQRATQNVVTTIARSTLTSPVAKFAMTKPSHAPPQFDFSLGHPSNLSMVDMDLIKLTAQYTAANGREFLVGLALREQRNVQFDFLKPTHMLFSYFTSLVDAYAKILNTALTKSEPLREKSKNRLKALELAVHRWSWSRAEEERLKRESAEADAERIAFQAIDWFDFVVVETIDFPANELFDMPDVKLTGINSGNNQSMPRSVAIPPPPPPVNVINSRKVELDMDVDMDMDMDISEKPYASVRSSSSSVSLPHQNIAAADDDDDMTMNIVSDYAPRIAGPQIKSMTMVDPLSGRILPVEEMGQHMKVQLLDPRWKIEQQRFQDKQRETGYAEGASIADNLKQFAQKRADIFSVGLAPNVVGNADNSINTTIEKVQWDGHQSSIPAFQAMKRDLVTRNSVSVAPVAPSIATVGPSLPGASVLPPPLPTVASAPMLQMTSFAPPPPTIAPPAPHVTVILPPAPPLHLDGVFPATAFTQPQGSLQFNPSGDVNFDVDESAVKKQRIAENELIPEAEFATRYPTPIGVQISVQHDSSSQGVAWGLCGQSFGLSIPVTIPIRDLKELVATRLKQSVGTAIETIPGNKMQLKEAKAGFLKDGNTLASHNVGNGAIIELSTRSRGGKR